VLPALRVEAGGKEGRMGKDPWAEMDKMEDKMFSELIALRERLKCKECRKPLEEDTEFYCFDHAEYEYRNLRSRLSLAEGALKKAEAFLDENDARLPISGREAAALATIRSYLRAHDEATGSKQVREKEGG
jgi:hypothetical protein